MRAGCLGRSIGIQAFHHLTELHLEISVSSWLGWGCSLGQRNFSNRMDVGRIPFVHPAWCSSHPCQWHTGKEAVSPLEKDLIFLNGFGWPELSNYPDSQSKSNSLEEQPAPCPSEAARGAVPSQVRCMMHPALCSVSNSSKNKGYFEQAHEPFLQPICWHPQVL